MIGGGPAGERGAAQAAYFGKRVAVVERASEPGGAAVHTGRCRRRRSASGGLPSGYRQRDLYGVNVDVDPDMTVARLLGRKEVVEGLETQRIHANLERHKIDLIQGVGRVTGANTVSVAGPDGERHLEAEFILIVTGSSPHRPEGLPFDDEDVHDADGILQIDHLPRTLVVIGGGVIGCEYACMFAALGVEVHLIDPRPALLPFLDAEMGERLAEAMTALGVRLHLERQLDHAARVNGALVTTLTSGAEIEADTVLIASGRSGNTRGLGLEEAGVEVDRRGYVVVDEDFRTAVPSIYTAGDVVGFPALASVSMEQARVAVCHAFGFTYKRQVAELYPYGVYTIPEVSCVGLSEDEAIKRGIDVVVGRAQFADNVRGQIVGDRDGMVKLVFDRSNRALVGCHVIGERASELVHIGGAVITLGGTVDTFIQMVFNHPTLGETFKYAAYDALGKLASD